MNINEKQFCGEVRMSSTPTKCLVAAGFIIFRRVQSQIQYLLLQTSYGANHWTPPKGHVDPGESEYETALRETKEESGIGIEQMRVIPNFEKVLNYTVMNKPKKVVYWLSELSNPSDSVVLSEEHQDYKWLTLDDACKYASFPDMIQLLKECHEFLQDN